MRAAIILASLLSQSMAMRRLRRAPVDVGSIKARGTLAYELMPARNESDYVLGAPVSRLRLTAENALLDGAAEEWPLWKDGNAPEELPGDVGSQFLQTNDPHDWCASGDQAGYSLLNVSKPTMVPFLVPKDQENRKDAAVIIAPGGGLRFLSWTKEGTHPAKWLNSIGISAFVLKYRVPTNTVETENKLMIDAQRAISAVRSKAPELGLDPSRVGFMGFSAGAFMTGRVATRAERAYKPNADDLIDRTSHLPDFALEIYGYGTLQDLASPVKAPPTFIAQAEDDPCVPPQGALEYFAAIQMQAEGTDTVHELHIFSKGHHGYGDCSLYTASDTFEPICSWTLNAQLWLDRVVLGIEKPLKYKPMIAAPNI